MSSYPRVFQVKAIPIMLLLLGGNPTIAEDTKDYQLSLTTDLMWQGDFSINHDAIVGVDLQYYLKDEQPWRHFLTTGYRQSAETEGASLTIFNAGMGTQYEFGKLWGKSVYSEFTLGAMYSQEKFSVTLIDREASSSFQDWDIQASMGIGMNFSETYSGKLYLKQFGSKGNSLGLSFSTSF